MGSKLSFHGQRWTDRSKEAVMNQRNATALKVLPANFHGDDGPWVIESFKRNNPQAKVFARDVVDGARLGDWQRLIDRSVALFGPHRHLIDGLEYPVNEKYQEGEDIGRLADDTVQAAAYLSHIWPEIPLIGGNFSRGTPQNGPLLGFETGNPPGHWADWESFLPALRVLKYLSLHEYGSPSMRSGVGWHCLRYRRMVSWTASAAPDVFERFRSGDLKILITECGIDRGNLGAPRVEAGWRGPVIEGSNSDSDAYVSDLRWFADKIAEDRYVEAAFVFILGGYTGRETGWQSFELEDYPELIDVIHNYTPQVAATRYLDPGAEPPQPAIPDPPPALTEPDPESSLPVKGTEFLRWSEASRRNDPAASVDGIEGLMRFAGHLQAINVPFPPNESRYRIAREHGFPQSADIETAEQQYLRPPSRTPKAAAPAPVPAPVPALTISPLVRRLQASINQVQADLNALRELTDAEDVAAGYMLFNRTGFLDLPRRSGAPYYRLRSETEMLQINTIVVHHTGGPQFGRPVVDVVARDHTNHSGKGGNSGRPLWPAIAYHYYIEEDGGVILCNPVNRKTWHAKGGNDDSVGVAFSGDEPNLVQARVLRALLRDVKLDLQRRNGGRKIRVKGHRDVLDDGRGCPGAVALEIIHSL